MQEYFRKGSESEQSRKSSVKNNWELMQTCLVNITKNEDWLMTGKDQKAGQFLPQDGQVKEAGKMESERKPSCDDWNFWRQKSPMMP